MTTTRGCPSGDVCSKPDRGVFLFFFLLIHLSLQIDTAFNGSQQWQISQGVSLPHGFQQWRIDQGVSLPDGIQQWRIDQCVSLPDGKLSLWTLVSWHLPPPCTYLTYVKNVNYLSVAVSLGNEYFLPVRNLSSSSSRAMPIIVVGHGSPSKSIYMFPVIELYIDTIKMFPSVNLSKVRVFFSPSYLIQFFFSISSSVVSSPQDDNYTNKVR